MRIAQIAPVCESVPPGGYGGTERVVSWLTEELVRRGHRVTLFASGDSDTRARLVPVVETALRLGGRFDPTMAHVLAVGMAKRRASEFDVIHAHVDYLAFPAFTESDPPVVSTLHGRLDVEGLAPVVGHFGRFPLVSISDAQRAPLPGANWLATVHHGLPLADYPMGSGAGDYLLFVGRMSPEKRPDVAIDVARRAGVRLVLAAKVDRVDQAYFDAVVRPLLGEPGIEFIGEVGQAEKVALLRDARALLFPILWPEPFGLVMIEAMACGTPVVARRCGSVDEVIADGRVGIVCDGDEDIVRALDAAREIDRAACRRWVEQRFSVERMATGYERLYRRLVEARKFGSPRVRTLHPVPAMAGD
jgi:glycosyltransferase involved in cell wall biosynthesis